MKKFLILIGKYKGTIGTLTSDVDYNGCRTGWHTIVLWDGEKGLFAGNEIEEVKDAT
jgi:nucleoside-triphosphatase THEP1